MRNGISYPLFSLWLLAILLSCGCTNNKSEKAMPIDTDSFFIELDSSDGPYPLTTYDESYQPTHVSSGSFSPEDAFEEGFDEGYEQGRADRKHGHPEGYGYDDSNDYYNHYETRYCDGYEEGYEEGYFSGKADFDEEDEEDD